MGTTLTTESSALSGVTVPDFVYFQQHIEPDKDWIRIGFTGKTGAREDAQDDFEPVAVLQGCYDDEQRLHKHFDRQRVERRHDRSTYAGREVYDYVVWLLERQLAGRDRMEAERLPRLPWSVWSPRAQRHEGRNGEQSLFSIMPPRDRLRLARVDLPHLSSESDDWYTPRDIIEAARSALGSIDLDPASCIAAQTTVQAKQWYSKAQDGLRTDMPWDGNVWLNPPYGRGESSAAMFIQRLIREITAGSVSQAITCLNLASSCAHWFDSVWDHASIHCIHRGRPNFWNEHSQDSSPTKGIICSYFGQNPERFAAAFSVFGRIIEQREVCRSA